MEMENSDKLYLNELLPELLKSEPDLNRFKRDSLPKKHKSKAYRHEIIHSDDELSSRDLNEAKLNEDEKIDSKKDFIQPSEGEPAEQDNFQEFAIEDALDSNPLKVSSDEYSQSASEEYDMGGTDTIASGNDKTQLGGYSGNEELQGYGGSKTQDNGYVNEETIKPKYFHPLKDKQSEQSDKSQDNGYVNEETIKPKYYYPLKDKQSDQSDKSQDNGYVNEETIKPKYYYPLKDKQSDQSGKSQDNGYVYEEPIKPKYYYPLKDKQSNQDSKSQENGYVYEEPIKPKYYYPLKDTGAPSSTSKGITDQDFIALGQHKGQKSKPKYDPKRPSYGFGHHQQTIHAQTQAYATPSFRPTEAPPTATGPPSYYKGNRIQAGNTNYITRQDKKAQRKQPVSHPSKGIPSQMKAFSEQEDIVEKIGHGLKKVHAHTLPQARQMMNDMLSAEPHKDETIVEIVVDCNACGLHCPKQCSGGNGGSSDGTSNITDIIEQHCCGNNLMRIQNLCPKCAFIDTQNCPVAATEFDDHNENYHILEVGIADTYVPEMGDVQTPIFQKIRQAIQNFILRVYHDHPYYQDTLFKEIKNVKDHAIASMVIRFTKANNGNISPLYKAFMCKCGCDLFNLDISFKLTPANTSEIMEYCPAFCVQMDETKCNSNTMCSGCCSKLMSLTKVADINVMPMGGHMSDSGSPDYSRLLQQYPFMGSGSDSMYGGNTCMGSCPNICFPLCSAECCSQTTFGYKRSVGRYQSHPLNIIRS